MRLNKIEIENFRGFASPQTLPLDGDVVLVSGGNGTGKTSLTDAITWVLTGVLPGLADRLKGERKGEDYIVSRYGNGPARVQLTIDLGERLVTVERRGDSGSSELHIRPATEGPGRAAAELAGMFGFGDPEALATGVHAWGVLRQDAMRATLEQGSEQLHVRLREILGLGVLAEFEHATREACTALARDSKATREELDALVRQITRAEQALQESRSRDASHAQEQDALATRIDRLRNGDVQRVSVALAQKPGASEVVAAGQAVARLLETWLQVERELAETRDALGHAPKAGAVDTLATQVRDAEQRLRELETHRDAHQRLAQAALELLGDHCPVCAQRIERDEVRAELEQRLATAQIGGADLESARERLAMLQADLQRAQDADARARRAENARIDAMTSWVRSAKSASVVSVPVSWLEPDGFADAQLALEALRDELRGVYRALAAIEADPAIAAAASELEGLQARRGPLRDRAEDLARRHQRADALQKAATTAAVEITQEGLEALEPAFAEVYDRLAPHPSFTELRMSHDVYYGKGRSSPRIIDPVRGIEANPTLVCSEGQLNIIALSYFLALNLETEQGVLPFAILDDPLQAMDVINVLGFADVARSLSARRQLIVTTHDRRFAALLERKLGPREPGRHMWHLIFNSWDREGPHVEARAGNVEDIPQLLRRVA
ncbi:MAG: AAA family ATPase [Solirubrobacteraceae bacterium]